MVMATKRLRDIESESIPGIRWFKNIRARDAEGSNPFYALSNAKNAHFGRTVAPGLAGASMAFGVGAGVFLLTPLPSPSTPRSVWGQQPRSCARPANGLPHDRSSLAYPARSEAVDRNRSDNPVHCAPHPPASNPR